MEENGMACPLCAARIVELEGQVDALAKSLVVRPVLPEKVYVHVDISGGLRDAYTDEESADAARRECGGDVKRIPLCGPKAAEVHQ